MSAKVLGAQESGTSDVLVLIHGFPFDSRMWEHQLSGLSDIRRVVAVDLRGRGGSVDADPSDWTVDTYADDVAATLESLGAASADVAGMSMGGYVAMALLRRHPDKVRSLILIDTKTGDDPPEAKEAREKTAALVREKGTLELVNSLLPKLIRPEPDQQVVSKSKQMFADTPSETAAADALVMRDRPDSTELLSKATVPVLVIHGEQDQLMPVDGAKQMADGIPGARFVSIPDAGHLSPLENPEAVNAAIRSFLS